ncbi:hypothetical protein LXL04_025059 [Taraxacum kok-saghyz]
MVVLDIDFGLDCQSTANHYHGIDFPVVQRMVTLDIDFDLDCRSIANHYREFLGVDFGIDILRRMVALDTDFGLDCRSTANHYRETHIDHHNHTHYCKTHRHMSYYYNDCIHGFRSSPSYLDSSLHPSLHASNDLNNICKTHARSQIIRYTGIIEKVKVQVKWTMHPIWFTSLVERYVENIECGGEKNKRPYVLQFIPKPKKMTFRKWPRIPQKVALRTAKTSAESFKTLRNAHNNVKVNENITKN